MKTIVRSCRDTLRAWFDSDTARENGKAGKTDKIGKAESEFQLLRCAPFLLIHLGCFAALYTGVSWAAFGAALFWYAFRVFALTAFYHRYFSHRTFKTGRVRQFIFAVCAMTAIQRGPLWWAAHHRRHHLHSDTEEDAHSPITGSVWWSHFAAYRAFYASNKNFATHWMLCAIGRNIRSWFFLIVLILLCRIIFWASLYGFGEYLALAYPQVGDGWFAMFVWCGLISTVAVYHATFCVNSLCHLFG